jgi:SAM-dependent methyltransferase
MIAHARRRAADEGLDASFAVADAQVEPLPADGSDVLISRYGVMFFDRPTDAFANLVAGLRPGGRVALAVWQDLFANEWMVVPTLAVAAMTRLPEPPAEGAPSPFSLGDPVNATALLTGAGLIDVQATPVTAPVLIGGRGTLDEVVDFMATTGMARMLLAEADPEQRTAALAAMREALEPFVDDEGVRLGGATWLLTGHRPG